MSQWLYNTHYQILCLLLCFVYTFTAEAEGLFGSWQRLGSLALIVAYNCQWSSLLPCRAPIQFNNWWLCYSYRLCAPHIFQMAWIITLAMVVSSIRIFSWVITTEIFNKWATQDSFYQPGSEPTSKLHLIGYVFSWMAPSITGSVQVLWETDTNQG